MAGGGFGYLFARKRFDDARMALMANSASSNRRLLRALIALAPLVRRDLPSEVSNRYERVKAIVGRGHWAADVSVDGLEAAIETLGEDDRRLAITLLNEAAVAIDDYGDGPR